MPKSVWTFPIGRQPPPGWLVAPILALPIVTAADLPAPLIAAPPATTAPITVPLAPTPLNKIGGTALRLPGNGPEGDAGQSRPWNVPAWE